MNKQDIQVLYGYNSWANTRILNAAAMVTAAEFLAPAAFPHGGLRSTLTHLLSAEWVWRQRWEGTSPTTTLRPEDFATFDALHSRWLAEEKAMMSFVAKLTDGKLNDMVEYRSIIGDPKQDILWQMMAHTVNHGTQHRAEAAALLTEMGHSPGDIDMILYLRER